MTKEKCDFFISGKTYTANEGDIIVINGGGLYDHRKMEYVWRLPISSDALELVKYAYDMVEDIGIQLATFDEVYFVRDNEAMEWFRKITGVPNLKCTLDNAPSPIAKFVFGHLDARKLNNLEKVLLSHPMADKFDFCHSETAFFTMLPKGSHKGIALKKLSEILNVDIKNTIAIGDYYNDVQMLKTAGLGVAVANAADAAKAASDLVTVSNDNHAVAKIINDLDKGKIIL